MLGAVDVTAMLLVTAVLVGWGLVSARLERADLTAPIVFTVAGLLLGRLGLVHTSAAPEAIKPLVETTLVWVLFSDAARVRVRDLRQDVGRCVRLLAVGLPLSVLAGWGLAAWIFPGLEVWLALLVGAALAPTDAALGVPVVTNPVVPARIRRLLTVESGLNDGIATPVVVMALAGAASVEGLAGARGVPDAVLELAVGAAVGVVVGFGGGRLLRSARARGWAAEEFAGIAVLALALVAYTGALAVHGNGFIAAFVGGIAFGAAAGDRGPVELLFLEQVSGLVSLLVWLAFGAVILPLLGGVDAAVVGYAVLSLTVVRMLPVAVSLLGAHLDRRTVLFVGWFGPRGLASLVFALLALEELGAAADDAVRVVGVTVFLSVLAHGATSGPLAGRYGRAEAGRLPEQPGPVENLPVRGLPRAATSASRPSGTGAADQAGRGSE